MTQRQFVHNVQPGPREFITQSTGQPARASASNSSRPAPIDSRHLSAPGVPAVAANAFTGPEFERQARALVGLVEVYANQVAASGVAGPGVTVDDLKRLPLARLQQLAMATPATSSAASATGQQGAAQPARPIAALFRPSRAANGQAGVERRLEADEWARYDLNDPMGRGSAAA